jgi:rRNA maturation endonuclease Nob1
MNISEDTKEAPEESNQYECKCCGRESNGDPMFCRFCGGPLYKIGEAHLPGVFECMNGGSNEEAN